MVDSNQDGQADLWDVYPHEVKDLYLRFSPKISPAYASETDFNFSFPYLQGGESVRIYILSDPEFRFSSKDTVLNTHPNDGWIHQHHDYVLAKYAIANQVTHEETQVCCDVSGVPPCGTSYSDPSCCEVVYAQGCDVRYYPAFTPFRGAPRWQGAMVTQYFQSYPPGTECNWDELR